MNNLQYYLQTNPRWKDVSLLLLRFNPQADWKDLNKVFIANFRTFVLNKATKKDGSHYAPSTFSEHYKRLQLAVRSALSECPEIKVNMDMFGLRFNRPERPNEIYLTHSELALIEQIELSPKYNIIRVRFLVGAYTGARFCDFSRLSKNNIVDGKLKYMAQKTGTRITVPVHPYVQKVLESGIPKMNYSSEASERAVFDRKIKVICKKAGITPSDIYFSKRGGRVMEKTQEKWELVSSHTARRSFATNAAIAGNSIRYIQQLLGHSCITTTEKYILCHTEDMADGFKW
jgi:integrase